jgi:hypothetical protein
MNPGRTWLEVYKGALRAFAGAGDDVAELHEACAEVADLAVSDYAERFDVHGSPLDEDDAQPADRD